MLDYHHIIPRADPRCTDLNHNLAVICANCHRKVHAGEVIIEGVYETSIGTVLFWHKPGAPHTIRDGIYFKADGTVEIR